ncbi:hypothetical protein [Lactobacillus agrestimuris]|uniref:hypothetical protein n=1 Tax=Lactobacillus agrestimuris TaxID=2941328 RepID=UPI0020446A12|nr:hypothetical protein [Lactobacillus agrestimuris]
MKKAQKLIQKVQSISWIKKLIEYKFMPIICWSILVAVLPYLFSLVSVPIVWRIGLLFIIINSIISYHVGKQILQLNLKRWWLLILPGLFCLAIFPKFANYNLIFGIIYFIFELFGLMDKNIYR